jgi:Cu/Ag efflux protein CusF
MIHARFTWKFDTISIIKETLNRAQNLTGDKQVHQNLLNHAGKMKTATRGNSGPPRGGLLLCAALFFCTALAASCGTAPTNNTNTSAKRYQFTGRVVSIDKAGKTVDVDGDEIPGFMPFSVKDPKLLEQINPGDKIKADLVVSTDGTYLENITVTTKGNGTATPPPK